MAVAPIPGHDRSPRLTGNRGRWLATRRTCRNTRRALRPLSSTVLRPSCCKLRGEVHATWLRLCLDGRAVDVVGRANDNLEDVAIPTRTGVPPGDPLTCTASVGVHGDTMACTACGGTVVRRTHPGKTPGDTIACTASVGARVDTLLAPPKVGLPLWMLAVTTNHTKSAVAAAASRGVQVHGSLDERWWTRERGCRGHGRRGGSRVGDCRVHGDVKVDVAQSCDSWSAVPGLNVAQSCDSRRAGPGLTCRRVAPHRVLCPART